MSTLKNRFRYPIILLKQLVKTDFKLRYQGSVLGYVWSLLRPLALFLILYIVFVRFLKFGGDIPHFPVYLLLGIVLWNYFAEVTIGSINAIVGKGDLIRKINFPKYVIVLSGSLSALINLVLNLVVISVFMYFNNVDISRSAIFFPFLIGELFVFSLALAFFLSTAFVRLRDISYIWEVFMQAAFYITPIIYSLKEVPPRVAKLLVLNPVAQIIQDARNILITPETLTISDVYGHHGVRAIPITVVIVTVGVSALYFRAQSKNFAEDV